MDRLLIKTVRANGADELAELEKMKRRAGERSRGAEDAVQAIIKDVRERGDAALEDIGRRFDGGFPERFEVGRHEMERAFEAADADFRDALIRADANIRHYHERQAAEGYEISKPGIVLGQTVRGLDRVGLYVPGGTASYPSTVLMNGVPAKLAGVKELIVATPPSAAWGEGGAAPGANPDILAAAFIAGADRIFLMGGAQAIAALALGTGKIPRVDKIVGPGNIYVATAKRLLYGAVDIEMVAGPSEILVMADGSANPAYIAADMLSQAEHDADSAAVLLTTCEKVAERAAAELEVQLGRLERRATARAALLSLRSRAADHLRA